MTTTPPAPSTPGPDPVAASPGGLTKRRADDADLGAPGFAAVRGDCCVAAPRYRVVFQVPSMPAVKGELLLCAHHYRVSTITLLGLQASAYDETHRLIVSFT